MKRRIYKSTNVALIALVFATSCDRNFYLSEREFYAFFQQFRSADAANILFSDTAGGNLRITFDNSVSPPRVQSSNLLEFMRTRLSTFALLEGYPFRYFDGARISGEFEKQFDNWLSERLSLYTGQNNAEARLSRIDEMRLVFLNNPTFDFDNGRISFDTTVAVGIDAVVEVNALDPVSSTIFGGVNGSHNVFIDVQTLRLQGEVWFEPASRKASPMRLTLTPTPGVVAVGGRGAVVPAVVRNGLANVIKSSLQSPIESKFPHQYDHFSIRGCVVSGTLGCEYQAEGTGEKPDLLTVVRGVDNRIYQFYGRNAWSTRRVVCCDQYSGVQASFGADPAVALSGANTAEIVATTTDGRLYHRQFGRHPPTNAFVPAPIPPGTSSLFYSNYYFRGKPAVAATAPGQIDVVALRGSASGQKSLVHIRRLNGSWTPPVVLNLPMSSGALPNTVFFGYRDPVMTISGNKLFLLAATTHNKLYAMVFDIETGIWGQPQQLSTAENVAFAPAIASSGDGRVDLVYIGASGAVYHRQIDVSAASIRANVATTGFAVGPQTAIPGTVNSTPVLFSTGFRQLGLIARGTDNRLYYNRYVGPQSTVGAFDGRTIASGWNGFGDLNGNFIGTQILSDGLMEEFAASATKTGKIDVISKIKPTALESSNLHHNDYDAARFGFEPWRTVTWRGFEKIGDLATSGTPAIVAFDRNVEAVYVGQTSNIFHAQTGDDFFRETSFSLLSSPAPVAPTGVASGKGIVDLLSVGTDGKVKHVRRHNRYSSVAATLPGQTGLSFSKQPSLVGYGEGQLDAVAVATTGVMYHWRRLNGVWQNPVAISGTVSSAPILVNTGGGQLELFALGGDGKVYRWRFLGAIWSSWVQLPSVFGFNPNYFAHGSAASAGDGTVDLAVVRNQAGSLLYHRRVEPRDDTVSLPGQPAQVFVSIGSNAGDQPFVAVRRVDDKLVLVRDATTGNTNEYRYRPTNGWQFRSVSENGSGVKIGGATAISNMFGAIATDPLGRVFLRQTDGAQTFGIPLAQPANSRQSAPLFRPAIMSYSGQ